MTVANLAITILIGAIILRLLITVLRRWQLIGRVATPGRPAIEANRADSGWARMRLMGREDSAPETYLHRIAVLTGATQMGDCYMLDVGKTRFFVRAAFVRCLRDTTGPEYSREETCFYPARQEMPAAGKIGTALLQLKNNPQLFAKWSVKSGAFKATGEPVQFHVQQN